MYRYNLLGSIIKYTMGSIVFINGNYFLRRYARTTSTANMMMTIICTGIYLVFDFFHFQKKYKPTPDRAYTPMNIYIGFTLSPKRYAMRRLRVVLIYLPCES